jgi:hypothetical protein
MLVNDEPLEEKKKRPSGHRNPPRPRNEVEGEAPSELDTEQEEVDTNLILVMKIEVSVGRTESLEVHKVCPVPQFTHSWLGR